MEKIPTTSSKGGTPTPIPSNSSKSSEEHDALSKLLAQDPVLGQVMKIILGKLEETNAKLDETNSKLDSVHSELRRDLKTCQDQVDKLKVRVQLIEDDKSTTVEAIKTVNAKEEARRQTIEDCLGLPTILRRILEQFSDKELINLSLVNKLWNFEARSVLRDRGRMNASVNSDPICESLEEFASDLQQMRVIPFTGMDIAIYHFSRDMDFCETMPDGSLDPSYQVILDRLSWKRLSVAFCRVWCLFQDCPALVLVKRILEDYCGVLEELSIYVPDWLVFDFLQNIVQSRLFPCLKTLKVNRHFTDDTFPLPNSFMRALVLCAPNLEKFHMDGPIEFNENVMEGSSAVLVASSSFRPLAQHVHEGLIGALRAKKIYVACDYSSSFDIELLNRYVPMVIQASRETLKTLRMDLFFTVPLMCYGICLESVTELVIFVTDSTMGNIQPDTLALVKGFDFTRVFPRLIRVKIMDNRHRGFSMDDISAFFERGNLVVRQSFPDRAVNIKHLELLEDFGSSTALLLAQMFPHVTKISVKTNIWKTFPFTLLWEHFGYLTELHVDFDGISLSEITNWDSLFCGILPEEVAELRAKDDEYLKAVNIVPVMPSIACMRGLNLFTLQYRSVDFRSVDFDIRVDPTRMFSKVTGFIGFLRCPTLSVELESNSYLPEVLDHMKPYVTIVRH